MKKIAILAALVLGIASIAGAQGTKTTKPMTKGSTKMTSSHKGHMTSHKHAGHKHSMVHKHSMSTMKHGTMHTAPKPPTKKK